jgi:hypothetical protein
MTGGDIRRSGAESNDRKIGVIFVVPGARDEPNDLVAHEHPSKTAMAISPTSASDIRYADIGLSPSLNVRHDRDWDHFGREPYPHMGAACGRGLGSTPRAGTFARAGQ